MKVAGKTTAGSAQDLSGVHLWLILMKAFHAIGRHVAPLLEESGMGESDFRVLEALLHKGPLPVNTIGPKVFLTPGSISVAIDRLLAKGLVTRDESIADRRVRMVDLTDGGRALIRKVFRQHAAELESLARELSVAERRALARTLKKFGKSAEGVDPPKQQPW